MSSEHNFSTDEPITTLEQDILGRGQFSKNIAQAIYRYKGEDSLVIGLYGSWGNGKTSIINMVKEVLKPDENEDKKDKPLVIEFKPWYFSGQDQLLEQFFKHLSSEIKNLKNLAKDFNNKANVTGKFLNKSGSFLSKIFSASKPLKLIPGVGTSIETLEEISSSMEELGKALSGLKDDKEFDPITQKKELDKNLKKLKRKILIIIDDIDRLTKEEMRQMFQLVKGLANFPNTIYLLSFDPAVVTEALKDVQTGDGVKYLEKIIQVPFTVPEISRIELDSYFHTQVYNIISQNSEIDETLDQNFISKNNNDEIVINSIYWKKICSFYEFLTYFDNIREINRFLNVFRFEYDFIGNEVNTIDLLILSTIKSKGHNLYEFIRNNREIFSQRKIVYNDFDDQEYIKRLKNIYFEKEKEFQKIEVIKTILRVIFPRFNTLLGNNFTLPYNIMIYQTPEALQKHRKIGSSEIFDTFFQLSVPDHKIPYTIIKSIIELQDQPQLFADKVKEFIKQNKTQELFEELNVYIQEFKEENRRNLIKAMFPLSDLIDFNEIRSNFLIEYFSLFIKNLLKSPNIDLDYFLIELENEDIKGIYFLCELLYNYAERYDLCDDQRNFFREKINNSDHSDIFKKLEQLIDKRLQKKADDSALQIDLNLAYYLYTWKRINYEATKNYVNQLLETQKGIIHYFTGGLSYSTSNGERKAVIPQNYITYFTEIEPLINKVQNIKDDQSLFNQLPEKSQLAILTFLEQFSNNNQ